MSKLVAVILARGGSKSIEKKNIKYIGGQPLIFWSIQELLKSSSIDEVFVSTDDDQIERIIRKIPSSRLKVFRRSADTATDQATSESALIELIEATKNSDSDILFVQATSPFTKVIHFDEAIKMFRAEYDSVLSCVRTKRFYWTPEGKPINYDHFNRPRRQDFEGFLMENGAFYISNANEILKSRNRISGKIGIYEMPEFTGIEIDEPEDWIVAETLLRTKGYHADFPCLNKVKLFATDVDGVLTDAGMYYSEKGDELKKFNTRDGKGFELLRQEGIKTAIITSEKTELVDRRAKKLKADYLYQAKEHGGKLDAIKDICENEGISLEEVAYIGDDVNCREALNSVGLAACPSDALVEIKNIDNIIVIKKRGGEGVVREFIEMIISNNG